MKFIKYLLFILSSFVLFSSQTNVAPKDELSGAWRIRHSNNQETVKIYADGYFMFARFDKEGKKYIEAGGGTYTINGKKYEENIEYFTSDSTQVGKVWKYKVASLTKEKLMISTGKPMENWERIDDNQTELTGNWRITARANANGEMNPMQRSARKTLKILSGTRFQWAAINPETKQFFGMGGGTYTAKDGKYVETIEVFSRDNSRVGAVLTFDFEVKGSDWIHSGLSSKGDKIKEVWSREK
jgi:hypothetical protein